MLVVIGIERALWRSMIYIMLLLLFIYFITRSSSHKAVPKVAVICITCPTIRDAFKNVIRLF